MIHFTLNKLIATLLALFPVSTLVQGLPGMDNLNKLLALVLAALFALSLIVDKARLSSLLLAVLAVGLTIMMFVYDNASSDVAVQTFGISGFNIYFYFPFWCFYYIYIFQHFEALIDFIREHQSFLHMVCIIWHLIILVSMAVPSSYTSKWGGTTYFSSFANGEHRLASSCSFMMVLAWLLVLHRRQLRYLLYLLLPLFGIFMCGARTYLGVAACILVGIFYSILPDKKLFYRALIPAGLAGVLLVMISPMGDKFLVSLSGEMGSTNIYNDFWYILTSSRSLVWAEDLAVFFQLPIWNQLVGNGAGFVHYINYMNGRGAMWAHNDYLQVLMTNGYIGLTTYFAVVLRFEIPRFRQLKKQGNRVPWLVIACFFLTWIFNGMFNGVYIYSCASLMIPFQFYATYYQPQIEAYAQKQSLQSAGGNRAGAGGWRLGTMTW